jgi:hypothetical protein
MRVLYFCSTVDYQLSCILAKLKFAEWHTCFICEGRSHYNCLCCPQHTFCQGCVAQAEFVPVLRKTKGFCSNCLRMVIMIEKNVDVDSDGVITCMTSVKFPSFPYCHAIYCSFFFTIAGLPYFVIWKYLIIFCTGSNDLIAALGSSYNCCYRPVSYKSEMHSGPTSTFPGFSPRSINSQIDDICPSTF